jgi:KaiC/GvpD/RAD55 family RecA-like ATPase
MSLGSPSDGDSSSIRKGRHPTGITILDEEVLRGVPKGSTIAVVGDPDSESELVLHSLAATGRRTEYITTLRSRFGLMDDIKRASREKIDNETIEENVTIRDTVKSAESFGDTVRKSLNLVDDGNFIVDSFSSKHDSPKKMMDVSRRIHLETKKNDAITYLYFAAQEISDLTRNEQEILQMVDGVFNIKTHVVGTDNIENNLFINKLRGVDLPDTAQNLVYGQRVTIDVTADIG